MKLHLPVRLFKSVLACLVPIACLTVGSGALRSEDAVVSSAETPATVTISTSGDKALIDAPAGSLIITQLNGGYLYGSSDASFDVAADVRIDALSISNGYSGATYNFSGDVSGSGVFERTSSASSKEQTYVFTGDMSAYSGALRLSKENDNSTLKFVGNTSGSGAITIAVGNTLVVNDATMNSSSITASGSLEVFNHAVFAGNVSVNGTLNIARGGELVNNGTFTFGDSSLINLKQVAYTTDDAGNRTYQLFAAGGSGSSNLSALTAANISGLLTSGWEWILNDDGTISAIDTARQLDYAGGNLTWTTAADGTPFTHEGTSVAFVAGDKVTFSGYSAVTLGESVASRELTVATDVTVALTTNEYSLHAESVVVDGTLQLKNGGQNGALTGDITVRGTLDFAAGDVTGWSSSVGIKAINILHGGNLHISVGGDKNQTGAGLSVSMQGGTITGVSNANLDLAYGGKQYGYSSISALAAEDATAEQPTVSSVSGTSLRLRQKATDIYVAENARLDISSVITQGGNALNGEGAVTPGMNDGLTKSGVGELRLTGANTYTQATTVAEGVLTLADGGSLASSSVTVRDGAIFRLDAAEGLAVSASGSLGGSGTLIKTGLGSASLGSLADTFAGRIELQQGALSVGSPVSIIAGRELALGMNGGVLDADLSLGDGLLSIAFSGDGAVTSLNDHSLSLSGGTALLLQNPAYAVVTDLFSGVGNLLGADGNALVLDSSNNAASLYFDFSRPGTGFWADAILQLSSDGTLQLVQHTETLKEAVTITTRQSGSVDYRYYTGVAFRDISYSDYSSAYGGAIYGSTITLSNNGSVTFSGNTVSSSSSSSYSYGGAIYGEHGSTIELSDNGSVEFSGNTASSDGGAIYGYSNSTITLSENGSVEFSGNTASTYGGAIYGESNSTITLSDNDIVEFRGNSARSSGGAIYGGSNSTTRLSENGSVTFIGNTASIYGGAIYGYSNSTITLSENESVTFSGNTARYGGGAIYGGAVGTIELGDNRSVVFIGNTASSDGGAIYATGNLSIRNNDSVLFEKNAEKSGSSYRLRSIYAGGSGDVISLSAAEDKSIEFRDAVYIGSGSTVELNADYNGQKQTGDIIFTGKYTEQHLNELLAADGLERTAAESEIRYSRTTEVYAMTNLYGGRLRVEDGAIYKGYGITAMENSAASVLVKDAVLNHQGHELTFHAGTTLELAGSNTISGDVRMLENSTLLLNVGETVGCTDIIGNLDIAGGMTLSTHGTSSSIENGVLMYVSGDLNGWTENTATGRLEADSVTWVGNLLVLNYNESTFNRYFNGSASYNTRQEDKAVWHHYQTLMFSGNTASAYGAIYGGRESTIKLSDNGRVEFSGNTASSYGGAIYAYGNLSIRNNDSVLFEKNAEESGSSYRLRSIYADGSGKVISLSAAEGKSIEFRDAVYIGSGSTVELNADYNGQKQTGDIIFTGKYTEQHLNELLAADGLERTAAESEILNSRTTEVYAMTNLYGGRLRVEDGAIYKGNGITAVENSAASVLVKDAVLNHQGYELTFHAGTTLELAGNNTISGDVQMLENSTLLLNVGETVGCTDIIGNLDIAGGMTLSDPGSSFIENGVLMYVAGTLKGWTEDTLTGSLGNSGATWVDNLLVLNYNETTFNRYFNGAASYSTRQHDKVLWHHYQTLGFENCDATSSYGGAIYGEIDSTIELSGNGSVTFSGNTASSSGGAIYGQYGSTIELSENGIVEFSGNTASSDGGAILSLGNLSIRNNDSVLFERNAEKSDSSYRLRSIYVAGDDDISLSAAEGKSIEFRDAVYIASGSTVELNADYTDAAGVVHKQTGDIIFTGKYTEQHLNELLAADGLSRTAMAEEILNSRTTEVYAMTNLYGGRLRVEDGAIYKGYGITAMENSAASVLVKDAVLNHQGYELTFHAGTSLELAGNNTISGDVQMLENSTLLLNVGETVGCTDIIGNLDIAGGMTLSNIGTSTIENGVLVYVSGDLNGGTENILTGSPGNSSVTWVGNLLVLNYNESTFNRYFNGTASYSTPQSDKALWHHYQSLSFDHCSTAISGSTISVSDNGSVLFAGNSSITYSSEAHGGAITGAESGYIGVCNNETVEFFENTAHTYSSSYHDARGGAIYIGSSGDMELHGNGSLVFRKNAAETTYRYSYAQGGAIFAGSNSSVSLQHNGDILFCQNKANGVKGRADGGAIYGADIVLSHNSGEMKFCGNEAISVDASDVYAYAYGGAVYGTSVVINDNGSVDFCKNAAYATANSSYNDASAGGGAIRTSALTMSENGAIRFAANTAEALVNGYNIRGGAVSGSEVNLIENGTVEFIRNSAQAVGHSNYFTYVRGGAVYAGNCINLLGNDSIAFCGNTVVLTTNPNASYEQNAYGGAIYTEGNLNIRHNGAVLFERNAQIVDGDYCLRSIDAGGSGDIISLSAAEGKSIEFRDSVYIGFESTVELNADYTDNEGVVHKQTGDIIFTGKYTEQHLNELLAADGADRTATVDEIRNSRTTVVGAMTNLYGGRLRVEDGAIYAGNGITAMENSAASVLVKDAVLNHQGDELIFHAGTTLESEGKSVISGNLNMLQGSLLEISVQDGQYMAHSGSLSVEGDVRVLVRRDGLPLMSGVKELLILQSDDADSQWNPTSFSITSCGEIADGYVFQAGESYRKDNALYLEYALTDTVTWSNAAGDGSWNNQSANWNYEGYSFADIQGINHVVLSAHAQGSIELAGQIAVGSLRVDEACSYVLNFAENATLQLTAELVTEAESELTLHGDLSASSVTAAGKLVVDGLLSVVGDVSGTVVQAETLTVGGHLSGAAVSVGGNLSAASLEVDRLEASTLNLTDAVANNIVAEAVHVSGSVDVAGNLTAGGHLYGAAVSVGGTLEAASLEVDSLNATSLCLTDAAASNTVHGDVSVLDSVDVAGNLTVGGHLSGELVSVGGSLESASLTADSLNATELVLTDASADNTVNGIVAASGTADVAGSLSAAELRLTGADSAHTIGGAVTVGGAVDIAGSLSAEGALSGTAVNVGGSLAAASLAADSVDAATLMLTDAGAANIVAGAVSIAGAVDVAGSLSAGELRLTGAGAAHTIGGAVTVGGAVDIAGSLSAGGALSGTAVNVGGSLAAASLAADSLSATNLELTDANASNAVAGTVAVSGTADVAGSLSTAELRLTGADAAHTIGGAVTVGGAVDIAGSLSAGGALSGTAVNVGGSLAAASLAADSLNAANLMLTDAGAVNMVNDAVFVRATIEAAGSLTVGGAVNAADIAVGGELAAATVAADSLSVASLELTAADAANSVSGDLTADSVSLASGALLEVGGTLTAAEVLIHGHAKELQAGVFGAETMNFVLDRAALESLNLSYEETGTIARANTTMGSGFTAMLNGGTKPVQAAAYVYDISVRGGAVQLTADYAHDGLQVWYRSDWVGESGWTDYYIAGYDAVNGVETIDLGGDTVQGDSLFIAYEEGVQSSVVTNGVLEFAYVDMGGGQFELGADAEVYTDELYGKGETLVMHSDSVLNATELTLGTLALEGGELTVKKATINTMSGTEGTLNIENRGQVTVKSDVTLTGLENLGSLNLGKNTLTVNAPVDVGGDVTAGEVAVRSRGSLMASFDKLVADKVTVVNNIPAGRYTDDLSVGDGSAIGELVAETLEVRGGTVTLGRTDAATEQVLKALDLQDDAALVLNQRTALSVTDALTATEGAELRLKQQASVSYGDTSIRNRGAAAQVVVNAYELANDLIQELSHAHVAVGGSGETSIDYKLTNSSVENTGSGKLVMTHAENTLSGVFAAGGDITVMNQALALNLDELVVGEGVNFSAYQGETEQPEQEAVVNVSQSVIFGAGAHINADLKLQSGVRVEMNGPVSMGSDLYLFSGMTLGGSMLENIQRAEQGQTVVLFSGIDRLYLSGEEQTDAIALSHGVSASDYFTNLISSQERSYYLVYDNELPGEGVLSIAVSGLAVPEPTTSMLSLLALAALAARRRRK